MELKRTETLVIIFMRQEENNRSNRVPRVVRWKNEIIVSEKIIKENSVEVVSTGVF